MKNNLSNIKKSKYFLNKGDCIGIPTETVYGLAANAYSSKATAKIYKLKKRPKTNPLIVAAGDFRTHRHENKRERVHDCERND